MPIFIDGIAIKFFRGIGSDEQRLSSLKAFNFFVGANNAGKSTVLDCLYRYASGRSTQLDASDEHRGGVTGTFSWALAIPIDKFVSAAIARIQGGQQAAVQSLITPIKKFLPDKPGGSVWVKVERHAQHGVSLHYLDKPSIDDAIR